MNKKTFFVTATVLFASILFADSLFVPLTSDEHLEQYTLKSGEVAYKKLDNRSIMMIGNDTKNPSYVSDDTALRCENILMDLDEESIAINKPDNIEYKNGYFIVSNVAKYQRTYTLTLSIDIGKYVSVFAFDKAERDIQGDRQDIIATYRTTINENKVTLQITVPAEYEVKLWNFHIKTKNNPEDVVNDTTTDGSDFIIKDKGYSSDSGKTESSGSTWKLSELRNWVANFGNGDRGRHWSNYAAINDIVMAGHSILWNKNRDDLITGFTYKNDKWNAFNNGFRSFYMCETEQEIVENGYDDASVHITDIDCKLNDDSDNNMYITFEFSGINDADIHKFYICYCDALTSEFWTFLKPLTVTSLRNENGSGEIKVTLEKNLIPVDSLDYWKIVYDPELRMEVRDEVPVWVKSVPQTIFDTTDVIFLNSPVLRSPSGKLFSLCVDEDGNLSTQEYTKKIQ